MSVANDWNDYRERNAFDTLLMQPHNLMKPPTSGEILLLILLLLFIFKTVCLLGCFSASGSIMAAGRMQLSLQLVSMRVI